MMTRRIIERRDIRASARRASGDAVSLTLRDVIASDLPVLFEHQLDQDATRMAAFPSRDSKAFISHWTTNILRDPAVTAKAILVAGRVAGYVVAYECSGRRLVGYWFGREYWGRGVATEALAAFLVDVRARPLHAQVAKHNVASIRVLEKCGFEVAGGPAVGADGVEELVMRLDRG
jgi:RimJ/RimL family protein N-acetyltransferase